MKSTSLTPQTLLLLAAVIIIWGSSFPIIKIALSEIPPLSFRAAVVPFGMIVLITIRLLSPTTRILPQGQWKQLILTAVFNVTGWLVFSAYGLTLLGSGHAVIIAYTMPLWASLFSMILLGEKQTLRCLTGLCFGLAGIAVLLSGKFGEINFTPLGLAFMIGAALSWGMGTVLQKRTNWTISSLFVALWQLVIGGLPIAIAALFLEAPNLQPISLKAMIVLMYVLLVPILFNWYAWFTIISVLPVTVASTSTLMIPVLGVFTGNLILGESIGWYEIGALTLVCSGLAFVLIPSKPEVTAESLSNR